MTNNSLSKKGVVLRNSSASVKSCGRLLLIISSYKKTGLADLTLIKALRQKEKFQFVLQIWLAPNLVFCIIPPFFYIKVAKKLLITNIESM